MLKIPVSHSTVSYALLNHLWKVSRIIEKKVTSYPSPPRLSLMILESVPDWSVDPGKRP